MECCPDHLKAVFPLFEESGCQLEYGEDYISIERSASLNPLRLVRTMPYPGFPTDAQAPVMALSTLAGGTTIFVENIFENRYKQMCIRDRHNVLNALAAFGVGVYCQIPPQVCADALSSYEPSGMRQRMRQCRGVTLVEDCYNASPDSMRAAITTLRGMECRGKKRMVLALSLIHI